VREHRRSGRPHDVDPICFLVAGALRAILSEGEFTLEWRHSVQKTLWVEHYRADGATLVLDTASVEGTGAGMEPPPVAVRHDGEWIWYPQTRLPELRLTHSSYVPDYTLCGPAGACRTLAGLVGPLPDGAVVTVHTCSWIALLAGGTPDRPPR
jgi:hypothetical protein